MSEETLTPVSTPDPAPSALPEAEAPPPADGGANPDGAGSVAETPAAPAEPSKLEKAQAAAKKLKERNAARKAAASREQLATQSAAAWRAQAEQERQRREDAERRAAVLDDPRRFLDEASRRGITSKQVAQAAIDESTPEGIARRALQTAEEIREENRQLREQLSVGQQRERAEANRKALISLAETSEDDFPDISAHAKVRPSYVLAQAAQVYEERGAAFRAQYGRDPTHKEVLQYLQWQHDEAAKVRKVSPAGAKQDAPSPGAKEAAAGVASAKTLTGRTAERATIPVAFEDLTDEREMRLRMAADLRRLQSPR